MQKLLATIDRVSTFFGVLAFVPWALILIVNIVLRQFHSGLQWYSEASQYLNIWVVFFVLVGTCAVNDNLRIDAVEAALKGKAKRFLKLLIALFTIIFLLVLGYSFFLLASRSRQVISSMTSLKMAYVYWPLPFLCLFSAVSCLLHTIWDFINYGKENNSQTSKEESKT